MYSSCHDALSNLLLNLTPDTLLNVFLAIAVDNLANAQELSEAEAEAAEEEEKVGHENQGHKVQDYNKPAPHELHELSLSLFC